MRTLDAATALLTWINPQVRTPCENARSMLQTYELFVQGPRGERRFEPVTCKTPAEAMRAARLRIEEGEVESVEVRLAGQHLFTLEA